MNSLLDKTIQFDSQQSLNYSGILVTALVGGLSAWTMMATAAFPFVVFLALTQLVFFSLCVANKVGDHYRTVFWLEAIVIGILILLVPSSFIYILTVVWIVQAVELYGARTATWFLAGSVLFFIAAQIRHFGFDVLLSIFVSVSLYCLLNVFALSVVQRSIREREQKEEMAALNRELMATRDLLSQSAAQGERLRISRDLHDILGHHMTALILNLEVASHGVDGKPKEKVEQSLALAKLLLGDLRSTVSELREESSINLEDSVKRMVSGIPDFDFDVDFSNAPKIDDLDIAETLLRCTQEAVTNVLRHSNADHCHITLNGNNECCVLSVSDNGSNSKTLEPGNGLKGMMERVGARGGKLDWEQNSEGFLLRVTLGVPAAL